MKLIWSFKCLSQLNNKLGFVWASDTVAASLISSGDAQFPGIGGRSLKYMQSPCGSGFVPGTIPKVLSSIIPADGSGIAITFDRPMVSTQSLQDAMSVIISNLAPAKPDHVDLSADKKSIGLIFPVGHFKQGKTVTWAYNDQHPTEELKGAEANGIEIDNQTYGVTNNAVTPNNTAFVSAETYNGWGIHVNLSDNKGYESIKAEWEVKVNGAVVPKHHTSGHDTNQYLLTFAAGDYPTAPMKAGDTITVSHKVSASGIKRFLNKPVTNNLT